MRENRLRPRPLLSAACLLLCVFWQAAHEARADAAGAIRYLGKTLKRIQGALDSDAVGRLLRQAISGPDAQRHWFRLLAETADDVDQATAQVKAILAGVESATGAAGKEARWFIDMLGAMRSTGVKSGIDDDAIRRAMVGAFAALEKGGSYREVRNLLTALHNAADSQQALRAARFLDDLGTIARRLPDTDAAREGWRRLLRGLAAKPLRRDCGWLGAAGEAKIGRLMAGIDDVSIEQFNCIWPDDSSLKSSPGPDQFVRYKGTGLAVEVKNWGTDGLAQGPLELRAKALADQVRRHARFLDEVCPGGGGVGQVVIVLLGEAPADFDLPQAVQQQILLQGVAGFRKGQVVFLGARSGDLCHALTQTLDIDTASAALKDKIKAGLEAAVAAE